MVKWQHCISPLRLFYTILDWCKEPMVYRQMWRCLPEKSGAWETMGSIMRRLVAEAAIFLAGSEVAGCTEVW